MLEYLMRRQGRVVTRTMLLEGVWDYRFDPKTNVIDVHISRLRRKIDGEGEPALIHTVRGSGYKLAAPRLTAMFRNATMRLIAAHLLLVAASTALVLGFLYWRVGGVIDTEQRAVVEAEMRGLVDDYARGGAVGARRAPSTSGWRRRPTATRSTCWPTPDGARIAATCARWPPTVAPDAGWTTLELYRTDSSDARPTSPALALRLPRGERLLVGRDVAARAAFDRTLGARAALGAGRDDGCSPSPPAGSCRGWCAAASTRSTAPPAASWPGSLDRRVALRGTGDEFDRLAGTLNAMLDRIETLVRDLRTVTDSLAHDLRSPLGRLVRHLEAAADEQAPAAARQDRIEQALREAEGVLSTATALLDISRIEAGIGAEQFTDVRARPPRRRRRRALRGRRRGARRAGRRLRRRARPGGARPRPAAGAGAVEPGGQRAEARAAGLARSA